MNATERTPEGATNLKKIRVEDIIIGMYVAALDRPWLETPFAMQGFYVHSDATIAGLSETCSYVYIDPRRYDSNLVDRLHGLSGRKQPSVDAKTIRDQLVPKERTRYRDEVEIPEEIESAKSTLGHAVEVVDACISNLLAGRKLDTAAIEGAVKPIVSSVIRNKEAFSALVRMKQFDQYIYSHAIACAVWAAILGRELGYPPEDIEALSSGCALMDIGKTNLPPDLLSQPSKLDKSQLETMRRHVEFGLDIASDTGLSDQTTTATIIKTHHERFDGSGYPDGLTNSEIPIFGRIAGLVDSYDAMITPRPHAPALTSHQALLELERNVDKLFQKELVGYFTSAIGIFPVGAVVELNSGEVGVVIKQHPDRRLRPKVMLILDKNKLPRAELTVTDLGFEDDAGNTGTRWILHELPKDSHGIDVSRYFLWDLNGD